MQLKYRTDFLYHFFEWLNLGYLRDRNSKLFRLRYAYYYILLTYVVFHRFYIFFSSHMSMESRIFHYDYARILFGTPSRYIIWISVDASCYDSFRRYVFLVKPEIVQIFQTVFMGKLNHKVPFPAQYFNYKLYAKTCVRLQKWVAFSFGMVSALELLTLPFTIRKIIPFLADRSLSNVLYLLTFFVLNGYAFHHVGMMMSLVSFSAASIALLFLYMLGKTFKNLLIAIQRALNGRKLLRWRRNYIHMMLFLFKTNKLQGPSLTWVIVCGTPAHAYLTMYLVSHPDMKLVDLTNNIMALSVVSTYIFGCHGYLSRFCSTVAKPAKTIYSHLSHDRVKPSIKQRLLLANLAQNIHSDNAYGYTYGSHGLMCHRSFNRFVFFYIKFMIMSYKLIFSV